MRESYYMRNYPFAFAPFLIAATLLLNSFIPLMKSKPAATRTFAAAAFMLR